MSPQITIRIYYSIIRNSHEKIENNAFLVFTTVLRQKWSI